MNSYLTEFSEMSATQQISMIIHRFSGCALQWAAATWCAGGTLVTDYAAFLQEFWDVFDHPSQGRSGAQKLLRLRQGDASVADYAIEFLILAADSGWNESALLARFRKGLNPDIQLELACKDTGMTLSLCISLAIKLDQHLHGQGWLARAISPRRRKNSRMISSAESPNQVLTPRNSSSQGRWMSAHRAYRHANMNDG